MRPKAVYLATEILQTINIEFGTLHKELPLVKQIPVHFKPTFYTVVCEERLHGYWIGGHRTRSQCRSSLNVRRSINVPIVHQSDSKKRAVRDCWYDSRLKDIKSVQREPFDE